MVVLEEILAHHNIIVEFQIHSACITHCLTLCGKD